MVGHKSAKRHVRQQYKAILVKIQYGGRFLRQIRRCHQHMGNFASKLYLPPSYDQPNKQWYVVQELFDKIMGETQQKSPKIQFYVM